MTLHILVSLVINTRKDNTLDAEKTSSKCFAQVSDFMYVDHPYMMIHCFTVQYNYIAQSPSLIC